MASTKAGAKGQESAGAGGDGEDTLPTLDFSTFILSLSHSALLHMGDAPHPDTDAVHTSLPMARQTIDLLGLLEDKTKGNLTGDEERLLTQILFDLRMRFLEQSKREKASRK
jgi:hypothetical protein